MTLKTIRRLPTIAVPWTAWAARLSACHRRWADVPALSLLFGIPWRLPASLLQRLSFHADFHTLVNLQSIQANARTPPGLATLHRAPPPAGSQAAASARVPLVSLLRRQATAPRQFMSPLFVAAGPAVPRTAMRHADTGPHRAAPTGDATPPILPRPLLRLEAGPARAALRLAHRFRQSADMPNPGVPRIEIDRMPAAKPPMTLRKAAPSPAARPTPLPADVTPFGRQANRAIDVPAAMALSAVNVEQLADQVLKQIDRRVVARRERMGQV